MTGPLYETVKAFKDETEATRDNLFAGLRNQDPEAVTASDVLSATQDATATQTSVAATAARLDATLTRLAQGGGGGADDQFERVDTGLGADWTLVDTGVGAIVPDGQHATWSPSGSSTNWVVARNDTVTTSTDNQISRILLAEPLNTTSGWLLILRANTALNTYVYGLVKKDYVEIGYVDSGVTTVLDSSTAPFDPPPGTKIDFACGGDEFELMHLLVTSSDPQSGSAYRNLGMGADIQPADGMQVSPGALELWTGFDWSSPPVVGVYLHAKPSTDVTISSTVADEFPNNSFGTVVAQSDFITYDTVTNTATAQLPGAYMVQIEWIMDTPIAAGDVAYLYAVVPSREISTSTNFSGTFIDRIQFTTVVYMNIADSVQPGYAWPGTPRDLTTFSSFKVTKLSPPYFA